MYEVLGTKEYNQMQSLLDEGSKEIRAYFDAYTHCIERINSDPIVQSFFRSGNRGLEDMKLLKKINSLIESYYNSNLNNKTGSLVYETKKYIEEQIHNLTKSNQNYHAASGSAGGSSGSFATREVK